MKVLVIGSGGREHTLCWKIAESPKVSKVYCAPGNGGIKEIAENIDIHPEEIDRLLDFAMKENIDLTVVGPEGPLVLGIVDRFNEKGLKIFGVNKKSQLKAPRPMLKVLWKNIIYLLVSIKDIRIYKRLSMDWINSITH